MLLADDLDDDEETIAISGTQRLPHAQASCPPVERGFPGRVDPGMLLGNYRVLRCIARGGMASVWVAHHRSARGLGKLVTLKTILPELLAEPTFEQMFLREARLASLIHHPNVCESYELVESDGVLALAMEWVNGASLSRMLSASSSPLDARVAARIAAQAAAGLHAAHELRDEEGRPMDLVHRDVSPQNILLSRDGHVRLSDFGIAKAMSGIRELSSIMRVQGKASYLSPEQARNEPLDRRSDVFSLGVVLYVAALGRRPFAGPKQQDELSTARLLNGEFLHPAEADPTFPPQLAEIIVRALQNDPARRYRTAAEMRHDLEVWLASSGPLMSEQEVAFALHARCGKAIEHQQLLIRAALSWEAEAPTNEVSALLDSARRASRKPPGTLALPDLAPLKPPVAEPRRVRLSRSARAGGAGALGLLGVAVWLSFVHHRDAPPAPSQQRQESALASEAAAAPPTTQPAPEPEPEPSAAPEGASSFVEAPPLPAAWKPEQRRPAMPSPSRAPVRSGHLLGPVEREL